MKKIELVQGSEDWLTWRKSLITATDAPSLLGASPYTTPYQCWQRKVGQLPEQKENAAMRQGKNNEPIAREWFNAEYGMQMVPCCVESNAYNYLGASLDGMSPCGRYLLEIKCNGDKYHSRLTEGEIPDFHMYQMQHQFLACDKVPEKCFYLSWNPGGPIVMEVKPDHHWLDEYLPKAKEFWRKVVFFESPDLISKDYLDMSEEPSWRSFAENYKKVCSEIKNLEEIKESYRKEIIKMCGDYSCQGAGIKVLKKITKGRIDYDAIPALKNIDIEKYRKKATSSWMITLN